MKGHLVLIEEILENDLTIRKNVKENTVNVRVITN